MTLMNLDGFSLAKATEIKNQLVAPGCLRARVISQELDNPETEYLVMCGMSGFACVLHGLSTSDEVGKKGTPKQCPEDIPATIFTKLAA